MAYAINNWDEHYELSYTKRHRGKRRWLPLTTSHEGKRFRRLSGHPERSRIFSAFILMLQIAAKSPTPGILIDERGESLTPEDMEDLTGWPADDFDLAIKVLSHRRIGWITGKGETLFDSADRSTALTDHTVAPAPNPEKRPIRWGTVEGFSGITDADRERWAKAYPACDLDRQLAAMDDWLRGNPAKARKSNWAAFIGRWLSKAQDRGGDVSSNRPGGRGKSIGRAIRNATIADPREVDI